VVDGMEVVIRGVTRGEVVGGRCIGKLSGHPSSASVTMVTRLRYIPAATPARLLHLYISYTTRRRRRRRHRTHSRSRTRTRTIFVSIDAHTLYSIIFLLRPRRLATCESEKSKPLAVCNNNDT